MGRGSGFVGKSTRAPSRPPPQPDHTTFPLPPLPPPTGGALTPALNNEAPTQGASPSPPARRPAGCSLSRSSPAAAAPNVAGAADAPDSAKDKHTTERLVVRGEATVNDADCEPGVVCLELSDAQFRGTPVGTAPTAARSSSALPRASATAKAASAPRSTAASRSAPAPPTARARHHRRLLPGRRRQPADRLVHGPLAVRRRPRNRQLLEGIRQRHRHVPRGRRRPRPHDPDRPHLPLTSRLGPPRAAGPAAPTSHRRCQ